MALIYYAPGGSILWTVNMAGGADAPPGDHIEVETAPTDLHLWQVVDGALVERPDAAELVLAEARANASLPRAEFLLACVAGGLLSTSDALLAAKGELPAAYASVIDGWTPEQQFEVGLRWAALTQVERLHPLILAVAASMNITDAQLDALFGIGGTP